MPTGADVFHQKMGDPSPRVTDGMPEDTPYWHRLKDTMGAGYFLDRFLYLFGTGLERLHACLDAWPFVVPRDGSRRVILGYNAYGCILVLENPPDLTLKVLNPLTVDYWSDPNLNFLTLIGTWLPDRRLPWFFDTSVYDQWRDTYESNLKEHEILGIGVPLSLGGKMDVRNFAPQDIVEYYEKAAPAYAEAFASVKR